MGCPPEIAGIILQIIQTGVLRIRSAGWSGDAGRCAAEAGHIHNLPDLLAHYSADRLRYYWDVERPTFIDQASPDGPTGFESLWNRLRPHVVGVGDQVVAH